jgi:ferredoxin
MITKVEVDGTRCVAVGNCAALAPAVFDQSDDDGTVVLLDATPPEHEHERVRDAALRCPAAAIVLHENSTADDE